ncbi:MAG: hypothetical protein QOD56_1791 [Gammaproteobacteria bacterium]|nr:hypothetical protein [Gammaproteobacteria bacterium]
MRSSPAALATATGLCNVEFPNRLDAGPRGTVMQPLKEAVDRSTGAMRDDFDRPVREVTGNAAEPEAFGLDARAVPEIDALYLAGDQETAGHQVRSRSGVHGAQPTSGAWPCAPDEDVRPLMRLIRCPDMLGLDVRTFGMLSAREGGSGVVLGFHRRQSGARVLLGLDVFFGPRDGSLSRVEIGRRDFGRARDAGSRNGLACIAHLLHRGAAAAG